MEDYSMYKQKDNFWCASILWYLNKMKNNLVVVAYRNYTNEEMESVIEYIIDSSIDTTFYVEKNKNKYIAINGQKRLTSINNFIDGKIKYHDKFYEGLSEDEKERFLKYPVRFIW